MIYSFFLSPALGRAVESELFRISFGPVPKPRGPIIYSRASVVSTLGPELFREGFEEVPKPRVKINCTRVHCFPALESDLPRNSQRFSRGDV
jgi:hypothetical protein